MESEANNYVAHKDYRFDFRIQYILVTCLNRIIDFNLILEHRLLKCIPRETSIRLEDSDSPLLISSEHLLKIL